MTVIQQASKLHVDAPITSIKTVKVNVFDEPYRSYFESATPAVCRYKQYELIFRWDVDRYVFDPKDQNFDFCIIC